MSNTTNVSAPLDECWPPPPKVVTKEVKKQRIRAPCAIRRALGCIWEDIMEGGSLKEAKNMFKKVDHGDPGDRESV
ncbi:unnamed protein product [Orchesella dallaii]|uniref:Uncharacterized protein n=1 Tax=Orchesella dallaii TaxID=48710 RepID=A0ABP1Q076_9HEXA